ncbi:MAG: LPS assembly protein LptD [Deltaproteobacteria bacterium]
MNKNLLTLLISALLLFIYSIQSNAQEITEMGAGEGPVTITADTLAFDPDTNLYIAEGNVEITQGTRALSSDRATYNKETKDARAEGRVILIQDGDIVSGESLEINMDSKKGIIRHGRVFQRTGNFYLTGDEIEKVGDEDYRIKRGRFTTCDGPSPSWSFSATTANITLWEYASAWNAVFYIRGVPAFYLPYMIMPVKKERQSGLLIPRVGLSDKNGFEMDNSFFWAISKNTDATISLNYLSRKGVEEGVEYRYALSKNTTGQINTTYLDDRDTGNERWTLKYRHEQFFTPTFYNKTNINYISDNLYYRTYGELVEERSQDNLESYVSFTKNWPGFSLLTQFKYFEDLRGQQDTTLQKVPEIIFTGLRQPIGESPFYFSLASSAVNFYRETGDKGERVDMYPRLSMTVSPKGYFTFTPEVGLRETAYHLAGEERWNNREMYDLKGTLSTAFLRVYNLSGESVRKVRHTVEPEIVYEYTPEVIQDSLPQFDPVDRIAKKNMITYSLNNRLAGKVYSTEQDYQVRELLLFKLSQGYDINEATDESRPFTDVAGQLRLTPSRYLTLVSDASYGTYDGYLKTLNNSLEILDKRGDSLSAEYRFAKDSVEYMRGKVFIKAADSLNLSYDNRYSILERRYLENIYAIDYHPQCWSIQFSYSERPDEKRYLAVFNLLGFGTVGKVKGATQY